jgi:enoyl-CoA hydratase/carnithine racemase
MATEMIMPEGAPEEVVTNALVREIDLAPFGASGKLALITLDNGQDHNRPNTFGPKSLMALDAAITDAAARDVVAVAITGKPFIFAAGADLSALSFLTEREQSLAIGKLGHDVFRRLGELGKPSFAFINGLALGGGLEVGLNSNYRTMASTALTGFPEVFLGLVPGWGGATLLPKLIGPERAVQVIMLNALANNTADLKSSEGIVQMPPINTASAIQTGFVLSVIGNIKFLFDQASSESQDVAIILSGGDAELIEQHMDKSLKKYVSTKKDLVLEGLFIFASH